MDDLNYHTMISTIRTISVFDIFIHFMEYFTWGLIRHFLKLRPLNQVKI